MLLRNTNKVEKLFIRKTLIIVKKRSKLDNESATNTAGAGIVSDILSRAALYASSTATCPAIFAGEEHLQRCCFGTPTRWKVVYMQNSNHR